jgi:type I restriction enzyme, S subunit
LADSFLTPSSFGKLISDGILEIGDGYRAKNDELGGKGIIFLRAGHVSDTHVDFDGVEHFHKALSEKVNNKLAQPGDVVVTTKGNSTGRVAFVTESMPPFVYSPHLSYWRCRDTKQIVPGFLRYWSKSSEFLKQLAAMKGSTDMAPYLSLADQRRLQISLPRPELQRTIARILGALDDKIELNRRMNETLEAMARALFKSWFIDFDPVRAKVEGRDHAVPDNIADAIPESFEYSEHGEIPKEWQATTLSRYAKLNPEVWTKGTRPLIVNYVDLSNAKWGRLDEIVEYTQADAPSRAQRVLRPGDTIVGTVRPGNGSYALIHQSGLTGSTGFAVLRPARPIYTEFTYLLATESDNIGRLAHLADGAAYPAVRPEVVAATQTVEVPEKILEAFSESVGPMLGRIAANENESRTLAALRDTLLPKLISGEIRVKDAEKMAEAVA